MNGKDCRNKGAPPKGAGHLPQNQEEQDRRRRVKQDIGEMVPAWIKSIELAVQHVRDPCHRMPVRRVKVRERPNDAFNRQAAGDLQVLQHVIDVIHVYEIVVKGLAENEPRDYSEKNTNPEIQPMILPMSRSSFGLKRRRLLRLRVSFFFA